jgi:hypothetical protein
MTGAKEWETKEIPSVICFSLTSHGEDQWGSDLSPDAIAMVHTKMELEPQSSFVGLDLLVHSFDGMHNLHFERRQQMGSIPGYTDKTAEHIFTAYLSRIFDYLSDAVDVLSNFKDTVLADIVVTVPTVGSRRTPQRICKNQVSDESVNLGLVLCGQECHVSGAYEYGFQQGALPSTP